MRYDNCRCANVLPQVVCRRDHVLFTLIVLVCALWCPSISYFAFVLFFVVLLPVPVHLLLTLRYSLTFIAEVDVNTNDVPSNSMRTSGNETVMD
jgi:hypothetical protein